MSGNDTLSFFAELDLYLANLKNRVEASKKYDPEQKSYLQNLIKSATDKVEKARKATIIATSEVKKLRNYDEGRDKSTALKVTSLDDDRIAK